MSDVQPTKACPWCAETILAAAKKCKHCGEFLIAPQPGAFEPVSTDSPNPLRCGKCGFEAASMVELNDHYERSIGNSQHGVAEGPPLSEVGLRTEAGLACPNCRGTQFKVKRSGATKFAAVAITPLALLRAGQVKCVTCGAVYGRG